MPVCTQVPVYIMFNRRMLYESEFDSVLLRVVYFWVFGGGIITCFAVLSFSLSLYNHYLWC